MSELEVVIALIWVHFIADFVLQTDRMAMSKSGSNAWLAIHVGAYSLPLVLFGAKFALVNAAAHFVTDWISSRATSKLWKAGKRHLFFVVIGLDQAIHMTCLVATVGLVRPLWG